MTIALRYIESLEDLEAHWGEIWPLLDSLALNHAGFLKRELRPNREERAYQRVISGLENQDHWLLIAEEAGEIVAVGTATIKEKGRTHPSRIGDTGGLFIKESARGQGLSTRMREMRHETLREHGIKLKESAVSAHNAQALQLWSGRSFGASLRKPLSAPVDTPKLPVHRIKDTEEAWNGMWRLLQRSSGGTESETKERIEADVAKRGAAFAAGEAPEGVIIGRVMVDPWLFQERVGLITELAVADGAAGEVSEALLARMEQWMVSKGATAVETMPIPHGEYQDWTDRGFEPELLWNRQEL